MALLAALYFLSSRPPASVVSADPGATRAIKSAAPHIEDADCWFQVPASRAARCGRLVAAETPGVANGRFVRLPFVIFRSGRTDGEAPLVFLHGGPGEPAGLDADGIARWWKLIEQSEWLKRQDLIVFDQRGAGMAEPSLKCPELNQAGYAVFVGSMNDQEAAARWRDAAKTCSDRLIQAGIPLDSYNTAASAEDLAALLSGLGYGAWNLYGVSYGTRLALVFLRHHPEGTRSAILDSVYPPNVHAYVEAPANAARAFAALFDDCTKRPACQGANPRLSVQFRQLALRAAADPLRAPLGGDAGASRGSFDSAKLIETLFGGFYSWLDISQMPGIINAAAHGDTKPLAPLIAEALDTYKSDDFSYGAFLSTECHDDWSYDSQAAIDNAAASADVYGPFARANLPVIACPVWQVGSAPLAFHEPVHSNVPVLILTGDYDPITPPAWAEAAAATLPRSMVIHFPGIGHGVVDSHRCADQLAARYLADPVKPVYHDCLIGVVAGPWSQTDDVTARLPTTHTLGAKH